ncbi:cytochrome d ubiquinol oxidase subunit II [Methylotenera sp.]|uniref:cytochrome d ubiquinol oxidase subunit II n=1 Tax=Methylotenera sp. TaxID=2051956 RepID=UPI002488348B|nr:cytochrome d ubiquinol oxidase subunit II [Methylotenera sp.]MDI1299291.1 cytochrome d ubiquinol oxidase subunit II [Methylotenera sp.]
MSIDITIVWAAIIFFGVMMYVVMDGFDLGIGMLYLFVPKREDRDVMMNTVAPVWDGNETWLVLGGAGLFAAFPRAYAVLLSALYLPLILMLLGLIFRGVAFEFRFKAPDVERHIWDKAFFGGSFVAAFFQGVTLGTYINGIKLTNGEYTAGAFAWVAPFPLFAGLGVVIAYSLLGCCWLIWKTDESLQSRMRELAKKLSWLILFNISVISIWTPLSNQEIAHRWFTMPNILWLSPMPILVALTMWKLSRAIEHKHELSPFIYSLCIIFLGYIGLGISVWPNIIPPDISIWQAAAPIESQRFALVGTVIIIPIILIYTAWSYYVFRGKVRAEDGYH